LARGHQILANLVPHELRRPGRRVDGDIISIVDGNGKAWRQEQYWPADFLKPVREDDEEESTVGKLPLSFSDEVEA